MSRRNRNKGNRRRKPRGNGNHVKVDRAPTMQGMQQVSTWDLVDIVPILGGTGNPNEPTIVQIGTGVNGWYYDCRQTGSLTPVSEAAFAYGAFTGQFDQLAELWSTYRLDSVEVQYVPLNPGAGYQSPTVSAVDPAGSLGPVNAFASEI